MSFLFAIFIHENRDLNLRKNCILYILYRLLNIPWVKMYVTKSLS